MAHPRSNNWPPRCPGRWSSGARCPYDAELAGVAHLRSSVLREPEHIAIGVLEGCDEAASTDVADRLMCRGPGGDHLGQLRLDVRHLPVGDGGSHPLCLTPRHEPDVLARDIEPDVVVRVMLWRNP